MTRDEKTAEEIAGIIERFLMGNNRYPQEWNDFVECRQSDEGLEKYRKRCDELDPLVNRPEPIDSDAIAELRSIVDELRTLNK